MTESAQAVQPADMFVEVLRLVDESNELSRGLVGREYVLFGASSIGTPRLRPAEVGFLRLAAWSYIRLFETGVVGVRFLAGLPAYRDGNNADFGSTLELIRRLRTFMQHNLDPDHPRDEETLNACELWFQEACGTRRPSEETEWAACVDALLGSLLQLMRGLHETLRGIERDSEHADICAQWRGRVDRHHPASSFDPVVAQVAVDLGQPHLDALAFRQRFYDRWTAALRALASGYDFETEARRLIEHSMITEGLALMPITGQDVMSSFGIPPGPRVRELLVQARALFQAEPCDAPTLLERLKADAERAAN